MTSIEIKNTRLNTSVSAEAENVNHSINSTIARDAKEIQSEAENLLMQLDSLLLLAEDGVFEGDPLLDAAYDFRKKFDINLKGFPARAREAVETLKAYEERQRSEVNPMCKTCKAFGETCNGTTCMTYSGCVFKR